MTPTQTGGSSISTTADSAAPAPAATYMLTLCRLASPVSIKPPRAPQLKKFKFFTSRLRRSDGHEQLFLHMGYFATLTEARNWVQLMRRAYPEAVATRAPAALLNHAARDARIDTTALSDTFGQQLDQALAADAAREDAAVSAPTPSAPTPSEQAVNSVSAAAPVPAIQRPPSDDRASTATRNPGRTETLEQTLELLASSEMWAGDSDGAGHAG